MNTSLRRLCAGLLLLFALVVGLHAQDLTGTWQGTLQIGNQSLRLLLKLSKEDAGMRAVAYSIDQGPQPIAGAVTQQGDQLKITFPAMAATIEGRVAPDGANLAGTFSQGPNKVPLTLMHVKDDAAWEIPAARPGAGPMAATANPAFEVATIKPTPPDGPGPGITFRGREFVTMGTTLSALVTFAYELHPRQLTNAPDWVAADRYNITAIPDTAGMPNDRQIKGMIQKLLADRFKLAFHREQKELAVYALTVGRTGPILTQSAGDPNGLYGVGFSRPGVLRANNASMKNFGDTMQNVVLDRPVVDQTKLTGRYDFTLTWTPDDSQFGGRGGRAATPDSTAPGLFTAIQEQLGLRLEPTRAMVEVLVIDHVEKPSDN